MGSAFSVSSTKFGMVSRRSVDTNIPRSPYAMREREHQRFGWRASRLSVLEPCAQLSIPRARSPTFRGTEFRGEFRGTITNDYRLGDSPFSSRMAGLGEELVPVSFSRPRAAMFDIRPNRATRTVDFWQ